MPGRHFEDLEVGVVYRHEIRRTVTEMDNTLISTLTMNPQPLHLDEEFARETPFGRRIVNSLLTLGITVGLSVADISLGTTLGNLGYEKIEFPHPVFGGDTLRSETTVLRKRESRSRPDAGVVWFEHRGYNQRGELVCRAERAGLMCRRPHSPERA